ncbi:cation:proton antiporter domain-containing protein [Ilumatobacter nonamiensis]|uniref:cation:proton antiporter domain-containing protein n=1 Tax=Ilumatobacter nonamiensis TaxID=467093 RepID=UPI000349DA88|nr:cation:proton antiporter [Ilumatobacter nonamiensis]
MEHEVTLIATVAMGVLAALVCGYAARRIGVPVIVGYLLGGVLVGPSTPGFTADDHAAVQLGEFGVIFMMFGVGLHFSLRDLARVKRVAVPGALAQMGLSTALGWLVAHYVWGWSIGASLVLGLAMSIASTVVLLRGLTDRGLLNTSGGTTAVGWLILEDLATVAILVLLPAIVGDPGADSGGTDVGGIVAALAKAAGFIVLVLVVGVRVLPWVLVRIARTRSRELFLLAVFSLAASTAYVAYELFGVSFALGAFLAGIVMGGTSIHHQIEAEVLPFRDLFAVLFFVSVGMAVDIDVVIDHLDEVIVLTILVVVGKTMITLGLAFLIPRAGRELVVVAAGLSQIGEFSFIVGQAGLALDLLDLDQYAIILAAAVLSIMVNPIMYRLMPATERTLLRTPFVGRRMRDSEPGITIADETLHDHVVVVGHGRVGHQTARALRELDTPLLIVDIAAPSVESAEADGLTALFGDASNSNILDHAGLNRAKALVVTLPNQTAAELVVTAAHDLAPDLAIIARAGTLNGVRRLHQLGARHVINPELEGGLEIVRHTLFELQYPMSRLQPYTDAIRRDAYQSHDDSDDNTPQSAPALDQLLTTVRGVDIAWHTLPDQTRFAGSTLGDTHLRHRTGASVVAIMHDGQIVANPSPTTVLADGDLLGLIGTSDELAAAEDLLAGTAGSAS